MIGELDSYEVPVMDGSAGPFTRMILEAGIRTSSSGNMQTYSIIVSRDPDQKKRLSKPHLNQKMVEEAPVLLTFCADFHRMRHWSTLNNAGENFDNFFSFMVAAIDAVLVSQTVALAAESRGLGLCFLGSTLANADQISTILELPDHVIPVTGFSLGFPAEDPDLRDRLPSTGIIHQEKYQKPNDKFIRDVYRERDIKGWERYQKSNWLREQIAEKGIQNLAQLYSEVKYTRESHQEYSRKLLTFLETQGFMNNM